MTDGDPSPDIQGLLNQLLLFLNSAFRDAKHAHRYSGQARVTRASADRNYRIPLMDSPLPYN
jgi:hypothetical protein